MSSPVLLCTDGSEHAIEALAAGVALLDPSAHLVVVSVILDPDPTLLTGTGIAGGVLSPEAFQEASDSAAQEARTIVEEARAALGLAGADTLLLQGEPASAICHYAEEASARAIVMGSRGRGGLKRAVLGSVSDHVVRHAPCPVVIVGAHGLDNR